MNTQLSEPRVNRHPVLLLCTGWRDMDKYPNGQQMVSEWFDFVERNHGTIVQVVEGGQRGADALCRKEAKRRGISNWTIEADWDAHGPAAGPLRNEEMCEFAAKWVGGGGVQIVGLAFIHPTSKGTRDMAKRIIQHGWWLETVNLPVLEVSA